MKGHDSGDIHQRSVVVISTPSMPHLSWPIIRGAAQRHPLDCSQQQMPYCRATSFVADRTLIRRPKVRTGEQIFDTHPPLSASGNTPPAALPNLAGRRDSAIHFTHAGYLTDIWRLLCHTSGPISGQHSIEFPGTPNFPNRHTLPKSVSSGRSGSPLALQLSQELHTVQSRAKH